jgi:hypothetical protein
MQQKKTKTILNAAKRKRYTLFSVGHWMTGKYNLKGQSHEKVGEIRPW